ncbi:hypothetical protein EVAR_97912_1 [Eumeta japonica]|uniref:Uncharacterized protein n=1 Tax=Eumeta variegata TaxID=151549 RepID=A0A4C2AAG2_EUMVA|nr:hypothetical protein EVAR_97912_1 [Eumeta japonica]
MIKHRSRRRRETVFDGRISSGTRRFPLSRSGRRPRRRRRRADGAGTRTPSAQIKFKKAFPKRDQFDNEGSAGGGRRAGAGGTCARQFVNKTHPRRIISASTPTPAHARADRRADAATTSPTTASIRGCRRDNSARLSHERLEQVGAPSPNSLTMDGAIFSLLPRGARSFAPRRRRVTRALRAHFAISETNPKGCRVLDFCTESRARAGRRHVWSEGKAGLLGYKLAERDAPVKFTHSIGTSTYGGGIMRVVIRSRSLPYRRDPGAEVRGRRRTKLRNVRARPEQRERSAVGG